HGFRPACATGLTRFSRSTSSTDVISPARTPTGSRSAPRSAFRHRRADRHASVPAIYEITSERAEPRTKARTKERAGRDAELTKFVQIEKGLGPEGRIAVVRFDRGDGINALSPEALRQLTHAARSFE